MKNKWCCLLLAAFLLAGCVADMSSDSHSDASSALPADSSETVSSQTSVEESVQTSSAEQTSSEISLPPDPVVLPGGLTFTFPLGWQSLDGNGDLHAVSADGTLAVGATFSPLPQSVGLTTELLETELLPELKIAWETYGMTDVQAEPGTGILAGEEYSAIFLRGTYNGKAVFQKQIYVCLSEGYLTITLTSYEQDQTDHLPTLFHQ